MIKMRDLSSGSGEGSGENVIKMRDLMDFNGNELTVGLRGLE